MDVTWHNGIPLGCGHNRGLVVPGFGFLTIGSMTLALSLLLGEPIEIGVYLVFGLIALVGAGTLIYSVLTMKTWRSLPVSAEKLADLETLLKHADKRELTLPPLPVSEPSALTNGHLEAWTQKANTHLQDTRKSRMMQEISFPKRYQPRKEGLQ